VGKKKKPNKPTKKLNLGVEGKRKQMSRGGKIGRKTKIDQQLGSDSLEEGTKRKGSQKQKAGEGKWTRGKSWHGRAKRASASEAQRSEEESL